MSRRRLACVFACSGLLVTSLAARQSSLPQYSVAGTLPDVVDGQPLRTFAFDPASNRLYAGARSGLYWSDLSEAKPRIKGRLADKAIFKIEIALDLGRVFYATPEEVGYVDLVAGSKAVPFARMGATDMVYEPTRHELYVSSRVPKVFVFNAQSGRLAASIPLPGWFGYELEAIPGRVFLQLGGEDGLYAIDGETRQTARWPVTGRVLTPAAVNADPAGQYLFLTSGVEVVAIDVAKAAVIGKVNTGSTASIAFDRGTGLLLAAWADRVTPTVNVAAYRPGADGLVRVARFENPATGMVGLDRTGHGFVQIGFHQLLVWSSLVRELHNDLQLRRAPAPE
jgi:hypothetical protein